MLSFLFTAAFAAGTEVPITTAVLCIVLTGLLTGAALVLVGCLCRKKSPRNRED